MMFTYNKQTEFEANMSKSIEFPVIETYDQALDAVRNMHEFQFQKTGGFMFIKYTTALKSTFPDPNTAENEKQKHIYQVRRECRGIGFDVKTNRIVTRKFHKFFNLNEKPESAVENINWERPFVVIEKLDGSLVSPIRVGKQIEYTTMLGLTNYGPQLAKFVKHCMPYIDYDGFSLACIEKGISPLFEWCSEKNLIVVKYARDMLTLLAMRYTESGYLL
jgi:RNA ligase